MKKTALISLGIIGALILIIVLAGMYKFNALQDDIFYSGEGMTEADQRLFVGSWVEPIPGNESEEQGFTLNPDGTASSINMATLLYKKWEIKDGQLILTYESIGNGLSFTDVEAYSIESVEKRKLYLKNGAYSIVYSKK